MSRGRAASRRALLLGALVVLSACGPETPEERLDRLARSYIDYAMHLDRLRPGEVDTWFGPHRLDTRGTPSDSSYEEVADGAAGLREELAGETSERGKRLQRRVAELEAVATYLAAPTELSFAEQTSALYDVSWTAVAQADIEAALTSIDAAMPGRGSVRARMASLRRRLVIPAEKRQSVFEAALEECRRRTIVHWELGDDEGIDLIWTRDVEAAWHRF
ncbi:MAG: hypothetical protein AAGL66_08920, partial [Pseudomonadota bacterium]